MSEEIWHEVKSEADLPTESGIYKLKLGSNTTMCGYVVVDNYEGVFYRYFRNTKLFLTDFDIRYWMKWSKE